MSVKISNNSKEVILDIETAVQAEAVNKVREIAEYGRDIVESVVIGLRTFGAFGTSVSSFINLSSSSQVIGFETHS